MTVPEFGGLVQYLPFLTPTSISQPLLLSAPLIDLLKILSDLLFGNGKIVVVLELQPISRRIAEEFGHPQRIVRSNTALAVYHIAEPCLGNT